MSSESQDRFAPIRRIAVRLGSALAKMWAATIEAVFAPAGTSLSKTQVIFQWVWVATLYLALMSLWSIFVRLGRIEFGVQDWIWEWRYARILREALLTGTLPLHTLPASSYNVTRFLSLPDVPLAPQIVLLRWLDPGTVFLVNLLLMVTVGYIGCLVIKRHFRLSIFTFTALALLVLLNGFVTSHIAIGHTLFSGYFYLPFFVLLVLQLGEGRAPTGWFALVGLVLFAIELQGTTQLYAICLIGLGLLWLAASGMRGEIFKAILAGLALNLYRLAPAALGLADYVNRPQPSYLTLTDVLQALVVIVPPAKASKLVSGLPVGWWELDVYVGIVGLTLLLFCGVYLARQRRVFRLKPAFVLSGMLLALFSLGYLYWPFNYLPIPMVSLVHVPSRFLILPLLGLTIIACVSLQARLNASIPRPIAQAGLLAGLLVLGHDLFQHARLWRVEHVFEAFTPAPLDLSLHIANRPDPIYTSTLVVSTVLSLAALGYTLFILLRPARHRSG